MPDLISRPNRPSELGSRSLRILGWILLALLLLVGVGVLLFRYVEGWSWSDSIFMVMTTVTTVGFREVRELDASGRAITLTILVLGVGLLFAAVGAFTDALLQFELGRFFGRRKMQREIAQLSEHYIICGAGRVGRSVARELAARPAPFVIIESRQEKIEILDPGWLVLAGDATRESTLREAGIERALGLVAATTTDATNIFIVLTARSVNPKIRIIARASEEHAERHLLTAGAESVISPYIFAGHRIAQSFLRPNVLDFLDIATARQGKLDLSIEEVRISGGSKLVGQTVAASGIRQEFGVIVLAIRHENTDMTFNPAPEDSIRPGDTLIAMGPPEKLRRLEQTAG